MRVAIDIRMIRHSGIGTYLRGLLRGLAEITQESPDSLSLLLVGTTKKAYGILLPPDSSVHEFNAPVYSLREQLSYPTHKIETCDLLHYPHYNAPVRWKRKLIVNFHDLNHLLFPHHLRSPFQTYYARYFYGKSAARAETIIVPTNFIRQQVIEHLGVAEDIPVVVPYAADEEFKPQSGETIEHDEDVLKKYRLPEGYLLAVGINKPHKNHILLLQALSRLRERNDSPYLVMIGFNPDRKSRPLIEYIIRNDLEKHVKVLGFIPGEDVPSIYRNARALVFPSSYEGFGLPVVEAMKSGTPVIASDIPAVREVAGDAPLYFDPTDSESLVDALYKMVHDESLRSHTIEAGLARQAKFSWRHTARRTLRLYQTITSQS